MGENNPFKDSETRPSGASNASKAGWTVAVLMGVLMAVFLLLWSAAKVDRREMAELHGQLDEATNKLANARAENQKSQDQITALQSQVADLEKDKEMAAHVAKGLEDEMRSDLESKDVTISKLQGKLTVNILDRIMFDSGEAVLKPDGEAVMKKIGDILVKHPELKFIHVIGHTDNIPIRPGARSKFASNWELSSARAMAAVHFLTEQAGVDPHRVGAVGYGEFRPIADNTTAEGRAKNRRIAVTILPDELAGADTVPAAKAVGSTNSLSSSTPAVPNSP
ncbi:MAG: peptidoglycan-binding lipoprotein OmpA family [Pedosphaera sp.]|nr:peptidoglycan-binding lipoprotein OmpA family [Pedosphaera sp.]